MNKTFEITRKKKLRFSWTKPKTIANKFLLQLTIQRLNFENIPIPTL